MKKLLVVGVIVLFLGLAIAPSVTALQSKSTTDTTYKETLEKLNFNDIRNIQEANQIKHSLLYNIVTVLAKFRLLQFVIIWEIAVDWVDYPPFFEAKMPILFFYTVWIVNTLEYWCNFWNNMSDKFGWDWEDIIKIIIEWYENNIEEVYE